MFLILVRLVKLLERVFKMEITGFDRLCIFLMILAVVGSPFVIG